MENLKVLKELRQKDQNKNTHWALKLDAASKSKSISCMEHQKHAAKSLSAGQKAFESREAQGAPFSNGD